TKDPVRTFPRIMITGLTITGAIYVLIGLCSVALVPVGQLADSDTPLVTVVETAAPGIPVEQILPFISMFAVANSALINMLMASRLLYGMARQAVLPPFLGKVHRTRRTPYAAILFTTALAFAVIIYVTQASSDVVAVLGGTTALLLLGVFTIVNICVLVLRRRDTDKDLMRVDEDSDPSNDEEPAISPHHFRTPTVLPIIGALACAFLVTPFSGRAGSQYVLAGYLLALGVVLWAITWFANRALRAKKTYLRDPSDLAG
ncbi:MAG TPA: APC family permease, partial [Lapillicoccus sp.]|nr:APC family permease [Lapillicoccus sp.]